MSVRSGFTGEIIVNCLNKQDCSLSRTVISGGRETWVYLLEETMGRGGWGGAWSHCEQTAKCFMPTWFIFTLYATSQWGCVGTLSRHRGGPGLKATRTEGILSKLRKGRLFTHPVHFVSDSLLKIYCFFFYCCLVCFVTFQCFFPPDSEALKSL